MKHKQIFACEMHFFRNVDKECASFFGDVPLMVYPLTLNHRQSRHRPLVYESNGKKVILPRWDVPTEIRVLGIASSSKRDQMQ